MIRPPGERAGEACSRLPQNANRDAPMSPLEEATRTLRLEQPDLGDGGWGGGEVASTIDSALVVE